MGVVQNLEKVIEIHANPGKMRNPEFGVVCS